MQHPRDLFLAFFSLCISVALGRVEETDGGTQFIYYNGTISGSFKHLSSVCGVDSFDSLADSRMVIGVNPPWDTNPFYFRFGRTGREHLYEQINGLAFRTADFVCMSGNEECGMVEYFPDYYYLPLQVIDLNEAKVSSLTLNNEEGYGVIGDQETWVSNGSVPTSVKFRRPTNYGEIDDDGCPGKLNLEWNSTTPFTYNVNFTNTTAESRFWLSAPTGNLTLFFSGSRLDNTDDKPKNNAYNPNTGEYTHISLDTSDPSMPNFTNPDGTGFNWGENRDGSWHARKPSPSTEPIPSPTPEPSVAPSALRGFRFLGTWPLLLFVMVVARGFIFF